jgi:hypothetical protein
LEEWSVVPPLQSIAIPPPQCLQVRLDIPVPLPTLNPTLSPTSSLPSRKSQGVQEGSKKVMGQRVRKTGKVQGKREAI